MSYTSNQFLSFDERVLQVAHDVKAPLAVLKHQINKLGPQNKVVIELALERISSIVSDLNPCEQQKQRPQRKVTLGEMLKKIIREKHAMMSADFLRRIEFTTKYSNAAQNAMIPGLPAHFERVLSNIFDNALEAIPSDKEALIKITASHADGFILLAIRDNGVGIHPSLLSIIGKTQISHNKIGGSGRGLFFVRKFLQNIDGDISFSNHKLGGAVVSLTIPVLH